MGMNKQECRKYTDPGLTLSPGSGVLLLEGIKHIVRAAVKNIAGRRALVLYFYNRERAAAGCFEPEYTLFQRNDDYITLRQIGDGNVKWREASLDNLGARYLHFTHTCAFYRQRDERITARFCDISDKTGFDALNALQAAIMRVRLEKRMIARDKKTVERMKPIPGKPRGLNGWIHREALPHYIFYDYKRGGKPMSGYCTACRHDVLVSGPKHNAAGNCPRCGRDITFMASGKAKRVWDRATVQVLQKVSGGELALRLFKVSNDLREWRRPNLSVWENARVFIRCDEAKEMKIETYYLSYNKGILTHWIKGERPRFSRYQYNFECDHCGHLYRANLEDTLKETPWQYSQLGLFCHMDPDPLEVLPYLETYLKYPALEYLVKLRLTHLAGAVAFGHDGAKVLNENGRNFRESLGVEPADLHVMQKINADVKQLELYQHLLRQGIHAGAKLLTWYLDRNITATEDVLIPLRYMTPGKFTRYADGQIDRLKGHITQTGSRRYDRPGRVVSEYKDYLLMGGKLGYDFSDDFVLFPKNLPEAHDQASKLYDNKKIDIFNEMIRASYAAARAQYHFTKNGFTLIPPKSAAEIVQEGHTLHHCVHSYVERVANGECVVLFLRRTANIKEPFFTVELRDGRVTQVRGHQNGEPTPEVRKFLELWERKKLHAASISKAA